MYVALAFSNENAGDLTQLDAILLLLVCEHVDLAGGVVKFLGREERSGL